MATFQEQFWVCGAAGYPDPFRCETLEDARRFALEHEFNHTIQRKVDITIRRRLVIDDDVVWTNASATTRLKGN